MRQLIILFFLSVFSFCANAQTYIQNGKTSSTTAVTIIYDENEGGNRPNIGILFKDGFDMFNSVMPVCPGTYAWCLRDSENEDVAYMNVSFSGNTMVVKVRSDKSLNTHPDRANIKKHVDMLGGVYKKSR